MTMKNHETPQAVEAVAQAIADAQFGAPFDGFQWPEAWDHFETLARAAIAAITTPPPSNEHAELIAKDIAFLGVEMQRWLDKGPNEQPHYANGVRPFSTGDLKHFVATLTKAADALQALSVASSREVEDLSDDAAMAILLNATDENDVGYGQDIRRTLRAIKRAHLSARTTLDQG